jgi:ribonuclease D
MAILRELWVLREQLARIADRPPFKILNEDTLLRVAQTIPRDAATLGTISGVTPRVLGRWGGAMLEAVERALALDEGELPVLPRHKRPSIPGAMSRRIDKLRRWRVGATEQVGLEPGVHRDRRGGAPDARRAGPRGGRAAVARGDARRGDACRAGRAVRGCQSRGDA